MCCSPSVATFTSPKCSLAQFCISSGATINSEATNYPASVRSGTELDFLFAAVRHPLRNCRQPLTWAYGVGVSRAQAPSIRQGGAEVFNVFRKRLSPDFYSSHILGAL